MPSELARLPAGFPEGFGTAGPEREASLVLACLQGITPRAVRALAWAEGSATRCLHAIARGDAGSDGDRAFLATADPTSIRAGLRTVEARFAVPGDPDYWPALVRLADPPVGVFVRGAPLDPLDERVAIVGARRPTSVGREIAEHLARTLALVGIGVVSGGAIGIDAAAHRGALDGAGRTVVVLGSGIDLLYPRTNERLLRAVLASGGTILSEYPPGTPAVPWRFPARNRLIAALSRGVVVVEGREPSGTRITAEHAIDLGAEVFAVPGPVTGALSATPLALIRDGATMIRDAHDLLEDLGYDVTQLPTPVHVGLLPDERQVLDALTAPMLSDSVVAATGLPVPRAVEALGRLELRGIVVHVGGRYRRAIATTGPAPTV